MNNSELRAKAKEACTGSLVFTYFIYELLIAALSGLTATGVGAVIAMLFEGPLFVGLIVAIKDNLEGREAKVKTLFSTVNNLGKTFVVSLLTGVYVLLWSLLFVIPGIIKSYAYALVYYIHNEDPDMKAKDVIAKSEKMMNGHKWELFCLEFGYIGWIILSMFTFGILLFWVLPKMETAKYLFYQELKKEAVDF